MNDDGRINRTDRGDLACPTRLLAFFLGYDWVGVHQLITEKVEAGDIQIVEQADSLVVCKYIGPVWVGGYTSGGSIAEGDLLISDQLSDLSLAESVEGLVDLGAPGDTTVLAKVNLEAGTVDEYGSDKPSERSELTLLSPDKKTVKRTQRKKQAK